MYTSFYGVFFLETVPKFWISSPEFHKFCYIYKIATDKSDILKLGVRIRRNIDPYLAKSQQDNLPSQVG